MPRPLRILLALASALVGLALIAGYALVVRGTPLLYPAATGRLETTAPAPALEGQTFSPPGFPVIAFQQEAPGVFALRASQVQVRRRLSLRPLAFHDRPKTPPSNLRAALEDWISRTSPGVSIRALQLPPYFP